MASASIESMTLIHDTVDPTTNKTPVAISSSVCTPNAEPRAQKQTKRRPSPQPISPSPIIPKQRCPTRPNKPNLRLFTREFKFALPLAPSKHERAAPGPAADEATTAALGQCVDLALRLLEQGRGNRVLVAVGKQIVAERRAEAARTGSRAAAGIYKGDLRDMPVWVGRFLQQVRETGIPICVCDNLSGYGLTQRWGWGTDMEDYDCRHSAIVYIHQCLVDGLLRSTNRVEQCHKEQEKLNTEIERGIKEIDDETRRESQRLQQVQAQAQISLERAVFSIAVFLAHEFVHCFTGFLTGSAQPGTPPTLNASPYSDREHGEAGWYWTRHTFGGLGHVWYEKGEPAEPGHFGVPMLLQYNKRRSQSFFYQINHEVIRSIIGADWAFADRIDSNWFLKLKDETTRIPFREWDTAYEEIVARNMDKSNILKTSFDIHLLFQLIRDVLTCLSSISKRSLRNIPSLSPLRSGMRYSLRPSLPTLKSISKVKRWGRKRMGLFEQ